MRSLPFLAALALTEGALAAGLPRAVQGDGFLSIPVGYLDQPQGSSNALRRRGPIEAELVNMDTFYTVDITIGSPAQAVSVLLDTGSSDLWVSPECTPLGSFDGLSTCDLFGSYLPSSSRSAAGPKGEDTRYYGDPTDPDTQTSVTLTYYADDLTVANGTIKSQILGVMTRGVENMHGIAGIFGLAPDLEAGFEEGKPYSLALNSMVDQGLISSRAFSLDLRHAESETGAVIYGGLDLARFTGKLASFPLKRGVGGEARLAVSLSTVGVTRSKKTSYPVPSDSSAAILDSGTTLSRLHPRIARPILSDLGASVDPDGFFLAPCSDRRTSTTVDFGFGEPGSDPGATLRIRASDFILDTKHPSNGELCYVGLTTTAHQQILGDSVLRGGYFVFDWDNEEVHIAPAANCGSEIVAIGEGKDAVPGVEGKCVLDKDGRATQAPTATTRDSDSRPTTPVTSTYTVTECPDFDRLCTTGVVATQTFFPAGGTDDATDTSSATGSTSATSKPSATDNASATGGVSGSDRASDGEGGNGDEEGAAQGSRSLLDVWVVLAVGLGGMYVGLQ